MSCKMRFKAVKSATSVTAARTGECETHCHDQEYVDMQKNNSGIRAIAADHVSQARDVAAVTASITAKNRPQDRTVLEELGGHWMEL